MPRNSAVQIEIPSGHGDNIHMVLSDVNLSTKKKSSVPNPEVTISRQGSIKTHDGYHIFPVNDVQHKVAIGYFDYYKSIWTIQKVQGSESGMVIIQDCNKNYLCANSYNQVSTDSCEGPNTKWWIEDDHYFKNVHGSYLIANDGKVYCDEKGQWSKFDIQPVVNGSLAIINKKSYTGRSRRYYFRLAEKKLRCWNKIPKEFEPIISKPKKRFTLHWPSSSYDNPKQEWECSNFKYIAKVSTQKIAVSFLEGLEKEPLYLEAPTAEQCDIWYNALQLECKTNIVKSDPRVSVSLSLRDSSNMSFELGSAETVDYQSLKNIVEQNVNKEKLEREKKKEDHAKFQQQLDEKQTTARRIEQEIEKENKQMIRKREELACITNQKNNSKECLKNRLIELQQQRKGYEKEIKISSSDEVNIGFKRCNNERFLKIKMFLKKEATFLDPKSCDLVAKQEPADVNLISNFMKKFDISSVNEAVRIIFTVMQEPLRKENIEAKTNQSNKLIETDFLEKERIRIQKKLSNAEFHGKDYNKKVAEYNAGAKAFMIAQKKNNNQIKLWRERKNAMERDYEKSLEEYQEEIQRNA